MRHRIPTNRLYLFIVGIQNLAISTTFTIFAIYLVRTVGVTPFQLVLSGTIYEATIFLFEIPTGIVADVYSRRLSIIIGYALLGIGLIIASSMPYFEQIIIGMFVMGLGSTFISGALSAWIVDEVGQEVATQAFLQGAQARLIFGLVGTILSIVLASIALPFAIFCSGLILIALSIILIFVMPETGFQRTRSTGGSSTIGLFTKFRQGLSFIRGKHILLWIFIVAFISGGFGEGFGWLWQAHILDKFTLPALGELGDIIWFGIISGMFTPITLIATEVVRRQVDLTDNNAVVRTLQIVFGAMVLSVLLFALSDVFLLTVAGVLLTRMLMIMSNPLIEAWSNQHIDSSVRATVLSVQGQVNSLGEVIGGPLVGFVGTLSSIRFALSLSTLMLMPLIPVFKRSLEKIPNDSK